MCYKIHNKQEELTSLEKQRTSLNQLPTRASQNLDLLTHQLLNHSHNPSRIDTLMWELLP
jgi:hypothetical protein